MIESSLPTGTIADLANFEGGTQPPRSTFSFSPSIDRVRLIQIRDYKSDDFKTYIPKALTRNACSVHDIMIGRYGPPVFQILRGLEGSFNVALIKVHPKNGVDREFLYQVLKQKSLFDLIDSRSQRSSGQTGVDMNALRSFPVFLPELIEQEAIAEALSDADALIKGLERLIAKKQLIKQGVMEDLLTAKRRLPGFSGDWQYVRIGSFTRAVAGGTPSTRMDKYWGGTIPWMSSGELHAKRVLKVAGRITEEGLTNSSSTMLPAGCVLIGLAGQGKTRGTAAINEIELSTNQSIAAILPSSYHSSDFLYHEIDRRYEMLRALSTGDGGRGGLNLRIIHALEVPFPSLNEQQKVSLVLNEMDAEIQAVETRLKKARQVKEGMMQNLLTGRIRLV